MTSTTITSNKENPSISESSLNDTSSNSSSTLLISLLKFSTPAIDIAFKKVKSTLRTSNEFDITDNNNQDGELISSLLSNNQTVDLGIDILFEALKGYDFIINGISIIGYWSTKQSMQFGYQMSKTGVLGKLFIAVCNYIKKNDISSKDYILRAILISSVIVSIHRNNSSLIATKESADIGIGYIPIPDIYTTILEALSNKASIIWQLGDTFVLLIIRVLSNMYSLIRIALSNKQNNNNNTNIDLSKISNIKSNLDLLDYGIYRNVLSNCATSDCIHETIIYLLTKSAMSPNDVYVGPFGMMDYPDFTINKHSIHTLDAVLLFVYESLLTLSQFPIKKDVSIPPDPVHSGPRTADYASWLVREILPYLERFLYRMLQTYPEATRILLLKNNRFINLVNAMLYAPVANETTVSGGRKIQGYAIRLIVYSGQDSEIRSQLIACGVLEYTYTLLRRIPKLITIGSGTCSMFDWFVFMFDTYSQWIFDGLSQRKLLDNNIRRYTSTAINLENASIMNDATGIGYLLAVIEFTEVAQTASSLVNLRSNPTMYKHFEDILLTVASLSTDILIYQLTCTALNYLEVANPSFGKARQRSSLSISLNNKSEKHIQRWNIDDVVAWVETQPFHIYTAAFRSGFVDGTTLLLLEDKELIDLGITKLIHRKVILDTIATLQPLSTEHYQYNDINNSSKKSIGSGSNTVLQRSNINDGSLLENNLPINEMNVSSRTSSLSTPTRLENNALLLSSSPQANSISSPQANAIDTKNMYDVFISYRRSTGSHLARLISIYLQLQGFKPFIDVEGLAEGAFDKALEQTLQTVHSVVVILSEGALDRCITDYDRKDFVRKEIATALRLQKNVVPVHCNFKFPAPEELPDDIKNILFQNMIEWHHGYVDACISKLCKFLQHGKI